ncbi:NHL repeat-containing protein [Parenemella sanctibonifatiensis]|uniref:Uncharacterized protein n=1 Tax=Parenemella sanctibonifatiensis TaxID=2016505 RepID=A0A255EGV3_9ACTN|nr:hypothetical protein [Parenemella sanctibonifatiensis]OYN90201.1 hypothetical protein CGZ91_08500 [Parenemella sanctibonifatiensis]
MTALTVVEGDFGTLPDGTFAAFAAPLGEDASLNICSAATGDRIGRHQLLGAGGAPIVLAAPDGSVYVATYYDGHLYRWDPATGTITDLGRPTPAATYVYGLTAGKDGYIHGGTFPDAKAWSYHPDHGFTDLGKASSNTAVQYVSAAAYDPVHHALFVGTRPVAELYRIDLAAGDKVRVELGVTGSGINDLDVGVAGDRSRVFVTMDQKMRVIDADTLTEVAWTTDDEHQTPAAYAVNARGVSEAHEGKVWWSTFTNGALKLTCYDIATDQHTVTRHTVPGGSLVGYGWTIENDHNVLYAFAGNYEGNGIRFDVDADELTTVVFDIEPEPTPLGGILVSPDGQDVYANAFINGNTVAVAADTGEARPVVRFGQVEDWVVAGDAVYAGIYPGGSLLEWHPADGDTSATTKLADLKGSDQQIRPLGAKAYDGKVWWGTEPDYGLRGGTVAILDQASGEVEVHHDVVPDHTIAAIGFAHDKVYVGSSRHGGTGTSPIAGSAQVIEWDPASNTTVRSLAPEGAMSINALATGPQGHLYALVDTVLYEIGDELEVRRQLPLVSGGGGTSAGAGELIFHPNGYLYAQVGRSVYVVDPLGWTATSIASNTRRLDLAPDGRLWTLLYLEGYRSSTNVGQYTLPDGTADTREFVTVLGQPSQIKNRFVVTGETLQDAFTDVAEQPGTGDPRQHAARLAAVRNILATLESAGAITTAERGELTSLAARSR